MRKFYAVIMTLGIFLLQISAAQAGIINLSIKTGADDGYFFDNPNINNWYNAADYAKSFEFNGDHDEDPLTPDIAMSTYGYFKFDIAGDLAGYTAAQVSSATLNFTLREKSGMSSDPVPLGATETLTVDPYATAPNFTPYAGTRGTLYTGATVTQSHTMGVDVTTGDTELVSIDITDIVKGWLNGTYDNHGVEIFNPGMNDDTTFYWATSEDDGLTYGDIDPFLQVNAVPIPTTAWLLGTGLIGLIGLRRKNYNEQ